MEIPGRNKPLQTKMYSELEITITADQLDSQWYFPLLSQWVFTIVHISNHYVFAREWIKPNCTWIKPWFILSVPLTLFWIFLNLLLTNIKLQAVCDRSEQKRAEDPFLCQLHLPAAGAVVPSPNTCIGGQGLSWHLVLLEQCVPELHQFPVSIWAAPNRAPSGNFCHSHSQLHWNTKIFVLIFLFFPSRSAVLSLAKGSSAQACLDYSKIIKLNFH